MDWWRSIKRRRNRYAQLSTAERRVLWWAWLLLPPASALVRISSLERAQAQVSSLARMLRLGGETSLESENVRRLVSRAACLHLRESRCLAQSVVTRALIPALELEIGVRRRAEGLEAHAWVEEGGEPVGEKRDVTADFEPLGLPRDQAVAGQPKRMVE